MTVPESHRRMIRQRPEITMIIEEICTFLGKSNEVVNTWITSGPGAARALSKSVAPETTTTTDTKKK